MAFRVTDADVVRACTIGNRAVVSRGFSHLSPRRKSKEPLSRSLLVRSSEIHNRAKRHSNINLMCPNIFFFFFFFFNATLFTIPTLTLLALLLH